MHELGQFIKEQRKKQGLTQKELARILSLSDKAISKWEVGDSYPDILMLTPLADVFNLSVDELLNCRVDEKAKKNEITKSLMIANIAMNIVLIILMIVFVLLSLFSKLTTSSLVSMEMVSSPQVQMATSAVVLLSISLSFIVYNLLQYKKLGSGKDDQKNHIS